MALFVGSTMLDVQEPDHVVLLDPDGNESCVVRSPWTQDADAR